MQAAIGMGAWRHVVRAGAVALTLMLALRPAAPPAMARAAEAPPVMLWAWEWPQDLSFLADSGGARVGVAVLDTTVRLEPDGPHVIPRRQLVRVPPGTYLEAVVRVEIPRRVAWAGSTRLDSEARAAIVGAFQAAARRPDVRAVQCDFDAPASLRVAYRALLVEIREALPSGVGLSVTALGSWCAFDGAWLKGAREVVDDIVPMFFNMGPGGDGVWRDIAEVGDVRSPSCRASFGVATYEAHPPLPRGRRLYLFHHGSWDRDVLARTLEREGRIR